VLLNLVSHLHVIFPHYWLRALHLIFMLQVFNLQDFFVFWFKLLINVVLKPQTKDLGLVQVFEDVKMWYKEQVMEHFVLLAIIEFFYKNIILNLFLNSISTLRI